MFLTINLVLKSSGIDAYKQIRLLYDACLLTEDVNEINIFTTRENTEITRIAKSFKDSRYAKINYLFGPNAMDNYLQYTLENDGGDLILNLSEGIYFSKEYLKRVRAECKKSKSRECTYIPSHTLFYKDNILVDNRPIERANNQLLYAFDGELSSLPAIYSKKALSFSKNIVRSYDNQDISAAVLLKTISKCKLMTVPALSFTLCNNYDQIGVVGINNNDWKALAKDDRRSEDPSSKNDMRHASKFIRRDSATKKYVKVQYEINREYAKAVKAVILKKIGKKSMVIEAGPVNDIGIDDQLLQDWSEANGYEPMIRPSRDILQKIVYRPAHISPNAQLYFEVLSKINDYNYEHCVFVPHIIRGGADLAIIKIVTCLAEYKKVLVVTTLPVESPWIAKIESLKNVQVLQINRLMFYNDSVDIPKILYAITNSNCVSGITIINSSAGYEVIKRFGEYIINTQKVYLHAYAFDMTEDGYIFNVIQNGLVDTYKRVDTYITDSNGFRNQLIDIYGFNKDKIVALYLPTETDFVEKKTVSQKNMRKVLWASRVSSAKLVEVAVEIGALLRDVGIELHIYGALDTEYDNGIFEKMISPYQNIFYHGKYDGFRSIDVKEYDLYLLTSKNEGMPNVILEALAKNMFVVAPSVGGIPEVISDGINGYLVSDKFNPSAYVEKIINYYSKKSEFDKQEKVNKIVLKRHSQKSYEESVKKIYNL